jgi:hypothetical protein
MSHGLMWFPLLGIFIWLAKAGYDEYHKLEAYKLWAAGFDRAKYDIYAVMGMKEREISWGKPTKAQPKDLQTFSLDRVDAIQLVVDNLPVDLAVLPSKGKKINVRFKLKDREPIDVPFTEVPLAAEWAKFLQKSIAA